MFYNLMFKSQSFCASKDAMEEVKGQPADREEVFVNNLSDKRLVPKGVQRTFTTRQRNDSI